MDGLRLLLESVSFGDLSDEEINILSSLCCQEKERRIQVKLREGTYIFPTAQEGEMYRYGQRLEAIKVYRERCKVGIGEAKAVLDFHTAPPW